MSAQGIRAGRAFVEIGADTSGLARTLNKAGQMLQGFGKQAQLIGAAAAGAGAAILAPLIASTFAAASAGDELSKMADRTGASVESLSELRHAAEQSDVSFDQLGGAMHKMQRNLTEARDGNKTAAAAFDELGLSVDALAGMTPDQQLEAIADKIGAIQDPAERTAAAMGIFGKSGADLLPMFTEGADGIQALRKEARDLGLQVSGEDAAAATLFGDTWSNLVATMGAARNQIGFALMPVLTDLVGAAIPIVVALVNWIKENRALVVTVAGVGAALLAGGTALGMFGVAVTAVGMALSALATIGGTVAAVVAALASPIGLAVAGATAGVAAFLAWTETGQALTATFGEVLGIVKTTIGGILSALQSGDIALAGKIAFTGLKLAVATVMESVLGVFGGSIDGMMQMLAALWKRISEVINGLNVTRQKTVNWISTQLNKLGWGAAEDDRGRLLEEERLRIMAEKGIETGANDTSVGANLADIQQQDLEAAQDGLEAAQNMDPEALAKSWASAFDVASLQAEFDSLNQQAAEPAKAEGGTSLLQSLTGGLADMARSGAAAVANGIDTATSKGAELLKSGMAWAENLPDLATMEAGVAAAETRRPDTAAAVGGFNVAGLFGFGSDSMTERTARATEQTAANTARLAQLAGQPQTYE